MKSLDSTRDGTSNTAARLCAIHQPNFFPWLGYFDKIRRADLFVFLDDVAYPRSGSGMGSWCNRVKIAIQGKPAWVGCPIVRWTGTRAIREVHIEDSEPWRRKMLRTLEMNFRRSPNFDRAMAVLEPLIGNPTDRLADFNIHAVIALSRVLGLSCTFLRQSDMPAEGRATELLTALTRAAGANAYLCGGGADGYQDDALFGHEGIDLVYQNFEPLPYGNPERFIPGLSVIDYLMNAADSNFHWLGDQKL